jgi:hypothetical protein
VKNTTTGNRRGIFITPVERLAYPQNCGKAKALYK